MNTKLDFKLPEIAPINYLINISVPDSPSSTSLETVVNQKQLLAIQEQLDTIKRSEPSIEGVSYHHIHHYTVTYLVVAVAAAVAAVYGWRRVRRARRRLAPSARVEEPCDSEVNSVKLKVLSDVGQCKSNLVKSEVSDQAISERVFRKNRGTSPVRQSVFSITDTGV
ncbi:unnamed protein product, partial [Brenthis ino]